LCSASVTYFQKRDSKGLFKPVTIKACPSPPMNDAIRERCTREMAVVRQGGEVLFGARAVLYLFSHTGWGWFARLLAVPPFVWPIQLGYLLIARNRGWISKRFFGGVACRIDGNRESR